MLSMACPEVQLWMSLFDGLEYGIEQWNGKWKGAMNAHSCS